MKKQVPQNPWTEAEIEDDGLWHGENPRDNGIQPKRQPREQDKGQRPAKDQAGKK